MSYERWLFAVGVKREASAKGRYSLTTRGFDADAFKEVADVIADRLHQPEDDAVRQRCLERVSALCARFPLYANSKEPALV